VHSATTVAALPRRDVIFVSSCFVLVVGLAWLYLVHLDRVMSVSMQHDKMMADMGMTMKMPWTLTDVTFTFAMWTVMMIGMMTGSAAPVLLLFARAQAARGRRALSSPVLTFLLGYLLIWVGFSAIAALAQWGLHQAALLSPAMRTTSPLVTAAILVVAGAYQVTPFKSVCLVHCRSPLGFLMGGWRDGASGALVMGLRHGSYCLGCCWALMCLLFAVGIMNLIWVAAITVLVFIEKTGPRGEWTARLVGAAMLASGVWWAVR